MRLKNEYPLPWTVEGEGGEFIITAANGTTVATVGDVDNVYLNTEQAQELCDILKEFHEDQSEA